MYIDTQKHFEACFKQLTVSHFITLLVMINDTTTCEFMEDCLDMFLHLQLTQQGIPIFQHVQCLGEHFLRRSAANNWQVSTSCFYFVE